MNRSVVENCVVVAASTCVRCDPPPLNPIRTASSQVETTVPLKVAPGNGSWNGNTLYNALNCTSVIRTGYVEDCVIPSGKLLLVSSTLNDDDRRSMHPSAASDSRRAPEEGAAREAKQTSTSAGPGMGCTPSPSSKPTSHRTRAAPLLHTPRQKYSRDSLLRSPRSVSVSRFRAGPSTPRSTPCRPPRSPRRSG